MKWLTQSYTSFDMNNHDIFTTDALNIYRMCGELKNTTHLAKKANVCIEAKEIKPSRQYDVSFEIYDLNYLINSLEDIIVFICMPCACLIGLVLNKRVIYTIKKKKKSDLKDDFYKYMSVNSILNCAYCLIFALYPINICNQYKSDYFCSSVNSTYLAQYYKICFVAFLGQSIKMCSNISYILMSINCFMLIGREHSPFMERISKLELKRIVKISILVSLTVNIGYIFRFRLNDNYMIGVTEGFISEYRVNYFDSIADPTYAYPSFSITYPLLVKDSELFPYVSIFYFILNYCAFLVIRL
jgi:hypothetical protein